MTMPDPNLDPQDQALAQRLSRLGAMPVDTTRLDRALRAQLPAPPAAGKWWLRRALALAAGFMLLAALLIGLLQERPVQASADFMAEIHQELLTGKIATIHADSIDAANAAIAAQYNHFPRLPQMPADCPMACCCMKRIKNKNMVCILLNQDHLPVTLAVARQTDVCAPACATVQRDGATYHIQHAGDLNIVMTARQGCWVSMTGQLPPEKLIAMLNGLKF